MKEENLLPCPCCGAEVIGEIGCYEICGICDWEDDPVQREDPNYPGGANHLSLNDFKNKWLEKGQKT